MCKWEKAYLVKTLGNTINSIEIEQYICRQCSWFYRYHGSIMTYKMLNCNWLVFSCSMAAPIEQLHSDPVDTATCYCAAWSIDHCHFSPYPPGTNIKGNPTLHTTTARADRPDVSENTHIYHLSCIHNYTTNTKVANHKPYRTRATRKDPYHL